MRKASALVKRLTDSLAIAADAIQRGVDDALAAILPRPQAGLVPVRVRSRTVRR